MVVSAFFSLPQCIEGLKCLAESLFGVQFQETPLVPGESWHPDVLKLSLHHPDEGDLGCLYLDLRSRKDKHPICAHFAIKGGRRISDTEYQLPIVALVCNFSGPSFQSVLLNHSDVETLFHEFGHALHSLLSRTEYQHFSGTRVVLDFAEIPSNLFEYYAWDYRFLRTFAKHYSTGDPIPESLVKSLLGAKNMFAATELQRQVFYALIDQTLHASQSSSVEDTISIVADLKREHTCWKHVEGTHWHTRFSHLVTYGAGYYSYLYAKCFSAAIWKKIFEEDPLSPSAGSALRSKLLGHGGAKDPTVMLNDLVGNCVIRSSNGGIIPDITSLGDYSTESLS
ncbi:Mitochondrial intermediate peptidase [Orobanche hederae]